MAQAYAPVEAGLGPEESFLSLADILMSQERLPCRAESALPRLGAVLGKAAAAASAHDDALPEILELLPQSNSWIVARVPSLLLIFISVCFATWAIQGTKLEMPLWLAKGLYDNKRRILSVELPKVYKESWRTVFSADASVVDLHKMGPYYYRLGSQLLNFDSPENVDVAQTILQTFISRFRRIMDSSQNVFNEDTSALVAQLDELERALFQAGQKGLSDFQCWEMGQASQITVSSLVQNYKKRKFTDLDT
ncbi:DNA replication complex GINS protein PSF3 isoform X3 [Varanus komodoensis]|uniref:DNA replication complex GINS protein PSF3 isoform X3 n=1 Tax=Varanus komodoensis TaxID=61221 RepID=UPI001CF77739|nr:DNA replication complex GINS protein PSF3 isoform X3 [Varanus komodoensis]